MTEGNSFFTFGTQCDPPVHYDTLAEWCKVHADFSEAKRIGKLFEMKWWDNIHRRNAATGEGNATSIVWAQKNKFPKIYKERLQKTEQKINLAAQVDIKQLVANMAPEQLSQLVIAIEQKTLELEQSNGSQTTETKSIEAVQEQQQKASAKPN